VAGCPGDDSTESGETGGMTATDTDMTMSSTAPSTTMMPGTDDSTTDTPTTEPPETTSTTEPDTTEGPTTEPPTTGESTSTGPGLLDFTINFTGYDPHVGQLMNVKVFDGADAEVGMTAQNLAIANDSIIIPGIIEDGVTYNVRWWVDLSGNGTCDAFPTDHMWEMTGLTADGTGLTVDHTHDDNWVDVCSFW
jgi:hypothetical protein